MARAVAVAQEEERCCGTYPCPYPSHAMSTHGGSRDRAWLQDSIVLLIGLERNLDPRMESLYEYRAPKTLPAALSFHRALTELLAKHVSMAQLPHV